MSPRSRVPETPAEPAPSPPTAPKHDSAYKDLFLIVLTFALTGLVSWLTMSRNSVSQSDMETYIEKSSPYSKDRQSIVDTLKRIEAGQAQTAEKIDAINARAGTTAIETNRRLSEIQSDLRVTNVKLEAITKPPHPQP